MRPRSERHVPGTEESSRTSDRLLRAHAFAEERVGFLAVRAAWGASSLLLLAESYHAVDDSDYVLDRTGRRDDSQEAIRKALETCAVRAGVFTSIAPCFRSGCGLALSTFVNSGILFRFFRFARYMPHGALVLSLRLSGLVWLAPDKSIPIAKFTRSVPNKNVALTFDGTRSSPHD